MYDLNQLSWFKKYQPTTLDEYVFENEDQKTQIENWISQGVIPGNLLLYGNAGTGKSALAQLLIRNIIKNKYDVEKVKDKSSENIDKLHTWCQKQPISSKQKIVYIEEIDRASSAAFNSLKDGLMENYQQYVSFICTTNFINKIEYPVQTRFNFKFNLNGSNENGIERRLSQILELEQIKYDSSQLKNFILLNKSIGMRNMINLLQINCKENSIDFNTIITTKNEQEETIITLVLKCIDIILQENNVSSKLLAIKIPNSSIISVEYSKLLELINYNKDINYTTIYTELFKRCHYLPALIIIDKYLHESEYRKFQNIHFIAFIYDLLKCVINMNI